MLDRIEQIFENAKSKLERLSSSRAFQKPHLIYEDKIAHIDEFGIKLGLMSERNINLLGNKLEHAAHKLNLVSPLAVLGRGFAICSNAGGKIVKDSESLRNGDIVNVKLSKGEFRAEVKNG